jgi:Zn-finger nucleic acid-binding protein
MHTQPAAALACPSCHTGLVMAERQGIEIDYCPSCRGVWLDRGELDKIVERSAIDLAPARQPASQAQPSPWPGDRGHHDLRGDGHRKRRRPFLEELFD